MTALPTLTVDVAGRFAEVALANVVREFPNKPDHVLGASADARGPHTLHPAFYGSYDWHSAVHMHWLLVHLRRRVPSVPQRGAIDALLDRHIAPETIAGECAYLARPHAHSFERTYGWAWLLKLATELARSDDADARRWSAALAPLAKAFVARYLDYLPRADYPIRYGIHSNSAFSLAFAFDYARASGESALEAQCVASALAWYRADADAPAKWEPSGADFLSPALIEAELMRRMLPQREFGSWLDRFLPALARREPRAIFEPVAVSDRADPQIVHLDGLNLSRAWCWRGVAAALQADDDRRAPVLAAAAMHFDAGIVGLDAARYVGAHWLASFAALALDGEAA